MRYLFGFMCVLALAVMGCSETSGTGGSGGSAGSGGTGGDGVPIKSGLWHGGNPASNADGTPFDTGWAICFNVNEDGTALSLSTDCDIDEDDDEAYFLEISWKEDVGKNSAGEPCSDGVGVGTSFVISGFEPPTTVAIEDNSFEIRGSAAASPSNEGLWIVEGTFDGDVATGTAIWALPLGMGIPFCELEGEWTATPVVTDCTGVAGWTECILGDSPGFCFDGACHVEDCSGVEDGTDCIGPFDLGLCVAGSCEGLERCKSDDFCRDYNDCRADTCLSNGLCEERGAVQDGTPCAGGTCEGGSCVLESSVLPCTEQGIRNAIAAGDGPYTFDCKGPTSFVTQAKIGIVNNVILDGEGSLTVDGGGAHPVFGVDGGVTAELRGLTIINGVRGIESHGSLVLVSSEVRGCADEEDGGGIFSGGEGSLMLIDSTVSGNESEQGGGISNSGDGGAILVNSTVSGNTASEGGGIHGGANALTMINSTISGNSAESGSAIFYTDEGEPRSVVEVAGTLVKGDCVIEEGATIVSSGYNIESPRDTCGFDPDGTDQVNVSAEALNLGGLADNDGPTMTHALGAGSVAIDHIPAVDCGLTTDQRGEPRPETGGDACDVGSFERQPEDP